MSLILIITRKTTIDHDDDDDDDDDDEGGVRGDESYHNIEFGLLLAGSIQAAKSLLWWCCSSGPYRAGHGAHCSTHVTSPNCEAAELSLI
ncbi:hypothetical protein PoB_002036400 [Plakobranchus ocellatus]|uniref:Uncharacterized protein n=1 Tax=Plakobranchus ocellatus TaxID=259542 RepID=A0AAV3ZHJ5_9GAST|nr:hypothetical protein PoB_002036400 [Plakobranchus ocellatus]